MSGSDEKTRATKKKLNSALIQNNNILMIFQIARISA